MNDFVESVAHITCQKCGKVWQVLNEDGTDWDEAATAALYQSGEHTCEAPTP